MQKHERICYTLAAELLRPKGFDVWVEASRRGPKLVIWASTNGIKDRKTVSSSPGSTKSEEDHTRQWAQRLIRRLT